MARLWQAGGAEQSSLAGAEDGRDGQTFLPSLLAAGRHGGDEEGTDRPLAGNPHAGTCRPAKAEFVGSEKSRGKSRQPLES